MIDFSARCPGPRLSLSSSPGLGYSSCRQVAQQPFISRQSGIWDEFNLKLRHGWNQCRCVDEEVALVLMSETLFIFEKHAGARCAWFRHGGDDTLAETVKRVFKQV